MASNNRSHTITSNINTHTNRRRSSTPVRQSPRLLQRQQLAQMAQVGIPVNHHQLVANQAVPQLLPPPIVQAPPVVQPPQIVQAPPVVQAPPPVQVPAPAPVAPIINAANNVIPVQAQPPPQVQFQQAPPNAVNVPQQPPVQLVQQQQIQPPVLMYQAPIMPVVPFDGKNADIYDFIDQFESMAALAQWPVLVQAQMLSAYLMGEAKILYNSLDIQQRMDINVLKQYFIREYGLPPHAYWKKYLNRLPTLTESTKSFCIDIETLLRRALPQLPLDQREQMLKEKLTSVLPLNIQHILVAQDNRNWIQTKQVVEKLLPQFGPNEIQNFPLHSNVGVHHIATQPVPNHATSNAPFAPSIPSTQTAHSQHNRPPAVGINTSIVCFNCRGYGHYKRDCPSSVRRSKTTQQPSNRRFNSRSNARYSQSNGEMHTQLQRSNTQFHTQVNQISAQMPPAAPPSHMDA